MNERVSLIGGIKSLSKYILKYKQNFILFYIGWLLDAILTIATPILFAIMIDQIVYYKNVDTFIQVSLVFVAMSLFSSILFFMIYSQHHYLMSMYTFDIKMDIFRKLLRSKASYMSNAKTGDIITILMSDSAECMHFVIRNVIHSFNNILKAIFYITYIYIISVEAGIVITLFVPAAILLTMKFSRRIRNHSEDERKIYGEYVSWLFEILKGLTDIRLLNARKPIRTAYTKHLRAWFDKKVRISVENLTSQKAIELVTLLLQLSVFGVCAYLAFNGEITIGNVIVLVAFVFALKDETIIRIVQNYMDAQTRLTRIDRINRFMSQEDECSWKGNNQLEVTEGQIEFKKLSFAYAGGPPILDGLDLTIEKGSHVAIVGKSGSGKTTLTSLLIGLYDMIEGSIEIDGQSIADCSLKSLRQQVGIVQQDVLMFDCSIRDNLLLGRPKASDEEIWEVCSKAGIAEYINSLPHGLDTIIGKDGVALSGGQRQRLAIARVYLKNPAILIFDEATSALDSETEKVIHDSWNQLMKGRTSIVIAHRLSSVMLCDRVALMENGRIIAYDEPNILLENNIGFQTLFSVKESSHAK